MDEIICCENCRKPFEKSTLHYDPKKGVSRYYCEPCYAKKARYLGLQAAKRNFRNNTTRTSHSRKHY